MKKLLAIAIIILFIGMSVIPSVPSKTTSTRDIITVDDEGDGDYTSIKEAVNNTNPGDVIEVYSGTYYEHNITIEMEEITLKGISHELGSGNDTGKPFINGQGKAQVIRIIVEGVTVTGFRIENEGGIGAYGIIGIYDIAHNCVISNNDISNTIMCCIGCSSNNNKILNNTVSHSSWRQGILIRGGSRNNTVSGNVVTDIWLEGIMVWRGDNNTIVRNIVKRCNEGICLIGNSNLAMQNVLENNFYGIVVYDGFFNVINQNNFIDNTEKDAFFLLGIYTFPFRNFWFNNYWSRPRMLPYPIFGRVLFFIPWVQFDWRPALVPHNIGGDIE